MKKVAKDVIGLKLQLKKKHVVFRFPDAIFFDYSKNYLVPSMNPDKKTEK